MKLLTHAETKFVSGGMVTAWIAPKRGSLPTSGTTEAAMTAPSATPTQVDAEDSQRRMAPAANLLDHHLPGFRFDTDRMAPSNIDDDTYNGFNDQGPNV